MTQKTRTQIQQLIGAYDPDEFQQDVTDSAWFKDEIASQAEAEAGTTTNKLMTPERTAQAIAALGGGGGDPGYLEYVATLSQNGTNAPVANVLINTLVGTPTFARIGAGNYTMTLTGAWTSGKTVILPGTIPANIVGGSVALVEVVRISADVIAIKTGDAFASSLLDDLLGNAANGLSLIIMVFP